MSTVRVPQDVPSPTDDSERLRKAVQGWGTDEKALILVLGRRNAIQRKKIRETYEQKYNEALIDRLHSELSGDFRKAMILWANDPHVRDAKLVKDALKEKSVDVKDLQVIVEIACASPPHHLIAVRRAYCLLFECSLEEDIASSVSLPLRKLLVGLVSSYRFDGGLVDMNVTISEAARLHAAFATKELDHDCVTWILGTRNYFQLRATFKCYEENYGNSIDKDIETCGEGHLPSLLRVIVRCINAPEEHFAEVINKSILGLGTDEDSLTRAIVTRAEVDMPKIKEVYSVMYKSSLVDAVNGDTSGDYREFLLTLLGEKM